MSKLPPIISDDKIARVLDAGIERSYDYSGGTLSTIDIYPALRKQRQSDFKWFIEWLEKRPLISPEEDSITQFYPFRNILQRDIEALKKGLRE